MQLLTNVDMIYEVIYIAINKLNLISYLGQLLEQSKNKIHGTNVVMLSCSDDAKGRCDAVLDVVTVRSLYKCDTPSSS